MSSPDSSPPVSWYRLMTRYHWLVFAICTLGWSFDCLDQQLFAIQRNPAVAELLNVSQRDAVEWSGYATSFMLLGWATGGIFFGILGDKYGRSRIMLWTILMYSVFTGLSGLSVSLWDFLLFRFLAGLGIGGQFAVGASLVAETVPDAARPYALGFLQLFSAFGNMSAAFISMGADAAHLAGFLPYSTWRVVFMLGAFPAVLAYFVMRYLDEPEKWKIAVRDNTEGRKEAGSLRELFGPVYRRRVILGMILASTGVIGLWGIGFFSIDLYRTVGRRLAEERLREEGATDVDFAMIGYLVKYPQIIDETLDLDPRSLLGDEKNNGDVQYLFEALRELRGQKKTIGEESAIEEAINRWNLAEGKGRPTSTVPLDEVEKKREFFLEQIGRGIAILEEPAEGRNLSGAELWAARKAQLADYLKQIDQRTKSINAESSGWGSTTSLLMNIGALFGMYSFTMVTGRFGRRVTFTIFMLASMVSVIGVFLLADTGWKIYVMVPIMGFFLPALFGGYTIYFPELFPTRIRSTAISFCYNAGRFIAVGGPSVLALLTKYVFTVENGFDEPIRWAGATMSGIFLIGIAVVWMLPETKGKPLPE